MLMKRCVLIGFHISTSFPVKKLVWLEENRMAETERDFSEDEFSAASVEALRNFHYDFLKVGQIECLQWVLICLREDILGVLPTGFGVLECSKNGALVPTQISCTFFPQRGFFWQVFSGLRSNRICFVSGCSALLGF